MIINNYDIFNQYKNQKRDSSLFLKSNNQNKDRHPWRTGFYAGDDIINPILDTTPYNGRGWHFDFVCFEYNKNNANISHLEWGQNLKNNNYSKSSPITTQISVDDYIIRTSPELIIFSNTIYNAQKALDLIPACITMLSDQYYDVCEDGQLSLGLNPPAIHLMNELPKIQLNSMHVPLAAKLAAKISSSNIKKYALLKYWISKKICDVTYTETHSKACVGVSSNPYEHTAFAQAINSAYSVIEELNVALKDSKPIHNNNYTPIARENMKKKLQKHGLLPETPFVWFDMNINRKISKDYPLYTKSKTDDLRPYVFEVELIDAINRAGRLRNKLSAHAFKQGTMTLTTLDVLNVQNLAKIVFLSSLGFHDECVIKFF